MNEMTVFENEQFGNVRVIERDGDPWFIAMDVCRALDIANTSDALMRLDDDEKMTIDLTDSHSRQRGGAQSLKIINEPGLYALALSSRKPEAKAFKRWITHEVIPSIRKNGAYISGQEHMTDMELISKAVIAAEKVLIERERRIAELTGTVEQMSPKAEYFDDLVDRNTLTGIRETAKELDVRQNDFVGFLLNSKYCYRDQKNKLQPFAEYVGEYFELKETKSDRNGWSGTQLRITPKGREAFRLLVKVPGIMRANA